MITRAVILTLALVLAIAAVAQLDPLAWIDQHKVRAAYHYGNPPVEERVANLKRVGINAMILKASVEKALPWAQEARKQGLKCFFACNFNVNAEQEDLRPAVLASGVTEAFVCPLDDRFWHDHLTPTIMEAVQRSTDPDLEVTGLWIDFELYSTKTGPRYYTNACYCDHCFGLFCQHKGVETPDLQPAERASWLADQGWAEEYQPYLQTHIEAFATELRETIHAVNPSFLLGFYPTPHNWSLIGVARGFSTERVPILLWATDTYGGGGPNRVPDDWRQHYADLGINARYLAGMLLRCYSAKNLAANIYHTTSKCDGYWLFTTYTLVTPAEDRGEYYYLAAGEPEEYWEAIARGNAEIDRRLEMGEGYKTDLVIGMEPVVYAPLRQPDKRRQLDALIAPEYTGATVEYPMVKLRGSNMMVVAGRAGEQIQVTLGFSAVREGRDYVVWEIIDAGGEVLASGKGEVQQDAQVQFTPQRDGIYYLLATAQGSCYYPVRSNAPLGLYAGADLHTMSGAERLYFRVPEAVNEFQVVGKGSSARETIRVDLHDPAGALVATGQSDEEQLEVDIAVEAGAHAGEVWSLAITKADVGILEDNTIMLPAPLPPVLSLVPEHTFDSRPE